MLQGSAFAESEKGTGYWTGRVPCWVMLGCSKFTYQRCDAYLHPEISCWKHKVTRCEELLRIPKDCRNCTVYIVNHACPDPQKG